MYVRMYVCDERCAAVCHHVNALRHTPSDPACPVTLQWKRTDVNATHTTHTGEHVTPTTAGGQERLSALLVHQPVEELIAQLVRSTAANRRLLR